jgi:hypothetical protein
MWQGTHYETILRWKKTLGSWRIAPDFSRFQPTTLVSHHLNPPLVYSIINTALVQKKDPCWIRGCGHPWKGSKKPRAAGAWQSWCKLWCSLSWSSTVWLEDRTTEMLSKDTCQLDQCLLSHQLAEADASFVAVDAFGWTLGTSTASANNVCICDETFYQSYRSCGEKTGSHHGSKANK